ncbi:hypothetical protein PHAVU_009G255500 [Phaseolus vulgaris]|uniref:Uncharacterized protein n=1 Tax=Phaseolus vulgaris TaxID=3885 RepID=V7B0A1_PHAVU|nr:hypothetical protein PHAVU_009G255500g [Phaseolus vulgaris]ESW10985.1 hypothetical protein PHAVU_009G255500g [Phaseolus vulgaris]
MAGNKRVVKLISSTHPLEVNTKMQRAEDESGTMEFTYSHNNTLLTMKITQEICSGSVKALCIHLEEKTDKDNYCMPPFLEREVVSYLCRESGSGGCFTLEKKKEECGAVVRVKATHDFIVGEETMHVKVRIRYDDDESKKELKVEVEGPVKLTTEYMKHVLSKSERRMCAAVEASTVGNDAVKASTEVKDAVQASTKVKDAVQASTEIKDAVQASTEVKNVFEVIETLRAAGLLTFKNILELFPRIQPTIQPRIQPTVQPSIPYSFNESGPRLQRGQRRIEHIQNRA